MSFSIGIVGLPNVGKSTLFKALTKKQIDISNYPFCTIEPNVGIVTVPDARLDVLAEMSKSEKTVPVAIQFTDIAGLVKNAHQGEGLGNQFLAHIRETDAIAQVLRAFKDENIVHVDGSCDPRRDMETIELELAYADMATVEKRIGSIKKSMKAGANKEMEKTLSALEKIKASLDDGLAARDARLDDDEKALVKELALLTMKPIMYILNVDEGKAAMSPEEIIEKWDLPFPAEKSVVISAKIESEIAELSEEDRREYLAELEMQESGLSRLITKGYELLDLITYFTSGPKETRAWTITKGTKAPQAAGKIHTDFEKGFIRAEVVNWNDLVDSGSEAAAKEKGLVRTEGKEYVFRDGDVAVFRFSK